MVPPYISPMILRSFHQKLIINKASQFDFSQIFCGILTLAVVAQSYAFPHPIHRVYPDTGLLLRLRRTAADLFEYGPNLNQGPTTDQSEASSVPELDTELKPPFPDNPANYFVQV